MNRLGQQVRAIELSILAALVIALLWIGWQALDLVLSDFAAGRIP